MKSLNHDQLIALIERDKVGDFDIESMVIKKDDDLFVVDAELKSGQLNFEGYEQTSYKPEVVVTPQKSVRKNQKPYLEYSGKIHIQPEKLYMNTNYLIARVISAEKTFSGSKKIHLYPSPKLLNWTALSLASAAKIELKVKAYNTKESGPKIFFVESAAIVQPDLFKTELMSFIDDMLK